MPGRSSLALVLATIATSLLLTMCGGGDSPTGGGGSGNASNGSGAGSTSSGPCIEAWVCTPWDGAGTDDGTRTCTDANSCGTDANKPITSATLPALDLNYFKCNVTPILEAKCSQLGCHGTEEGRAFRNYARGRHRLAGAALTNPSFCNKPTVTDAAKCETKMLCECLGPHAPAEWQKNYDAARGFLLDAQGNTIPAAQASESDLIQQAVVGGKSHAGIHLFKPDDTEFTTIKNWLSGSTLGSCNPFFD